MEVLIADDHELVRGALKLIFEKLGSDLTVHECGRFAEALELAELHKDIDLMTVDLNMPDMDGMRGVELLVARFPEVPTLILSGYYVQEDIGEAFQRGVSGFIPKTLGTDAMLSAFRLVLAGEKYVPAEFLLSMSGGSVSACGSDNSLMHLTDRENDVLTELMQGLRNKEIARALGIEEITVKLHLTGVYKKLGARNRAHAVKIAVDLGWASEEQGRPVAFGTGHVAAA